MRPYILAVGVALLAVACDVRPLGRALGVLDAQMQPPVTLDIACDSGGSSGCTPPSLDVTLRTLVPLLPSGSVVRLHGITDRLVTSRELSQFVITAPVKTTRRAVQEHTGRQLAAIRTQFLAAAAPLFRQTVRHASPIASAIVRMVQDGNPSGGVQHLVLLTDAREYSRDPVLGRLDFECGLPPPDFGDRLARLFAKDSLRGVHVHFIYAELGPVDGARCRDPDTTAYAALREAWVTGLSRQGAVVTWSMGSLGGLE